MIEVSTQDARWSVHQDVATLRDRLDLTAQSLTVLSALLSFLPKGHFGGAQMVVFPSNETLCARAGQMHERTLRRHLTRLSDAGLIARVSSANGKRFCARNSAGQIMLAFGFDLSPLVTRSPALAQEAQELREERLLIKAAVSKIRALAAACTPLLVVDILKALRRKLTLSDLEALEQDLQKLQTSHLSVTDSQNDRHIEDKTTDTKEDLAPEAAHLEGLSLSLCQTRFASILSLLPKQARSWTEFLQNARSLEPWIGLKADQLPRAEALWGKLGRALLALFLAREAARIHHPQAYLERLLQNPDRMNFKAILSPPSSKFTAVNG